MPVYLFSSESYAHEKAQAEICKMLTEIDELCTAACPEQDEVMHLGNTRTRGELTCHEHLCRCVSVPG